MSGVRIVALAAAIMACAGLANAEDAQPNQEAEIAWRLTKPIEVRSYDFKSGKCEAKSSKFARSNVLLEAGVVRAGIQVYSFVKFAPTETVRERKDLEFQVSSADNGELFCMDTAVFEELQKSGVLQKHYKRLKFSPAYGLKFNVPFKIRRAQPGFNTTLTPAIAFEGMLGARFRISTSKNYHLILPAVSVGLSTMQIDPGTVMDSRGTVLNAGAESKTVTGLSASVGLVLELEDFQVGVVMGWDRATGTEGRGWVYNSERWYSLAIGYAFLGSK